MKHLIDYADPGPLYAAADAADYLQELGFVKAGPRSPEQTALLDAECGLRGKRAGVLMTYEK